MLPVYLLALAAFIVFLLARSGRAEKGRADERCRVYIEERAENWTWPPRPRPAVAETHPRSHEAVVPQAGRRAA